MQSEEVEEMRVDERKETVVKRVAAEAKTMRQKIYLDLTSTPSGLT